MFLERVGAMLNMRGAATVPRRRRQRSMKFAKSWECKESQTACMVVKLHAIALMAGLRKWPTIVKRISSTPIGFGCGTSCFAGRLTNAELEATETALFEFIK